MVSSLHNTSKYSQVIILFQYLHLIDQVVHMRPCESLDVSSYHHKER